MEKPAFNLQTAQRQSTPAWLWLLIAVCGVFIVLFAVFVLLVDDLEGGQLQGSILYWLFEAVVAAGGICLFIFGVSKFIQTRNEKSRD
jgi:hypothetical protein